MGWVRPILCTRYESDVRSVHYTSCSRIKSSIYIEDASGAAETDNSFVLITRRVRSIDKEKPELGPMVSHLTHRLTSSRRQSVRVFESAAGPGVPIGGNPPAWVPEAPIVAKVRVLANVISGS